jgi:hypothetical protein
VTFLEILQNIDIKNAIGITVFVLIIAMYMKYGTWDDDHNV